LILKGGVAKDTMFGICWRKGKNMGSASVGAAAVMVSFFAECYQSTTARRMCAATLEADSRGVG
jgi:hypothetical protein